MTGIISEDFGETYDVTLGIKSILDSYIFGNGNLRELLQNSDDAKATKQVCLPVVFCTYKTS